MGVFSWLKWSISNLFGGLSTRQLWWTRLSCVGQPKVQCFFIFFRACGPWSNMMFQARSFEFFVPSLTAKEASNSLSLTLLRRPLLSWKVLWSFGQNLLLAAYETSEFKRGSAYIPRDRHLIPWGGCGAPNFHEERDLFWFRREFWKPDESPSLFFKAGWDFFHAFAHWRMHFPAHPHAITWCCLFDFCRCADLKLNIGKSCLWCKDSPHGTYPTRFERFSFLCWGVWSTYTSPS